MLFLQPFEQFLILKDYFSQLEKLPVKVHTLQLFSTIVHLFIKRLLHITFNRCLMRTSEIYIQEFDPRLPTLWGNDLSHYLHMFFSHCHSAELEVHSDHFTLNLLFFPHKTVDLSFGCSVLYWELIFLFFCFGFFVSFSLFENCDYVVVWFCLWGFGCWDFSL